MKYLKDEQDNILGNGKGFLHINKENKLDMGAYFCSFCLKLFHKDFIDLKKAVKIHHSRCKPILKDGIYIFNKKDLSNENIKKIIDRIGYLSKLSQNIDFQITCESVIIKNNSTIFIYVEKGKIIGLLTVCYKKFKNEKNNKIWIQDFFVIPYMQKKGIGKILFDECIKKYSIQPKEMIFDSPSKACINFVNKYYGGIEKITGNINIFAEGER